ncbi:MAG: phosphoribosylpyrophosphate synthetase [Erythrobacter sp.]|nr:phosphoribosylpyrophosphate synthetase [Erythrobacter sp.]|tara:strand:- start:2473 stop:3363 length:891 start_codon:yes stop_codon:yes gene_type:complete
MTALILGFAESMAPAHRLAEQLGMKAEKVQVRRFPDQESLVTVPASASTVLIYRSLDDPDRKLIELFLAASAARDLGARRVILVAPYLAYMRQDKAFHAGEAVSQGVIGGLLAAHFDALLTVDPHLHRVFDLSVVLPGIPAINLSAAPALASLVDTAGDPLIVGPDSESWPWTESIARPLGLSMLIGAKKRRGDRDVVLTLQDAERVRGRPAVLVDDLISSGHTLIEATRLLRSAGATRVEAVVTHCLAMPADLARMAESGISRISASDSVPGPATRAFLAPLLAEALTTSLLRQT